MVLKSLGVYKIFWVKAIKADPFVCDYYRGADKFLARPGSKQANVSVRMA